MKHFCILVIYFFSLISFSFGGIEAKKSLPPCLKGAMLCGRRGPVDSSKDSSSHVESTLFLFGGATREFETLQQTWILQDAINNVTLLQTNKQYDQSQDKWMLMNTSYNATYPHGRWKGTLSCVDNDENNNENDINDLTTPIHERNEIPMAVLFGGSSPKNDGTLQENYFNDVWLLYLFKSLTQAGKENNQLKWKQLLPNDSPISPQPRRAHSSVYFKQRNIIIIFGGKNTKEEVLGDTWIFDLQTNAFKELKESPFPGKPRKGHTAVLYNSHMYIYGGRHGETYYGDMYKLDLINFIWSKVDYVTGDRNIGVPIPRNHAVAEVLGDSMFLFSGRGFHASFENFDELWRFHFETSTWSELIPSKNSLWPLGRIEASSAIMYGNHSTYMVIYGGEDATGHTRNDMWIYDAETMYWYQMHSSKCERPIPAQIKIFSVIVFLCFGLLVYYSIQLRRSARAEYQVIP